MVEKVIIMGFEMTDKPVQPKVILANSKNGISRFLSEEAETTLDETP